MSMALRDTCQSGWIRNEAVRVFVHEFFGRYFSAYHQRRYGKCEESSNGVLVYSENRNFMFTQRSAPGLRLQRLIQNTKLDQKVYEIIKGIDAMI